MKRIYLLPLLVIGVILVSGCGCYIHGDWVDFDDGDAEMASLMEEKPSAVPSPAPVAIGGGYSSTAVAVTHTPLPPDFIDRLFVFIDEPDEDTFDDMFTGPFGFICEFGMIPPEITSPSWDDTVSDDTPTISWTEAEGGYAPYEYWLMRAVGTLVMMVFWWPFHLLEIIVRYLTGFEVGSSWITSSLVVILLVSAIGWYVVLVLFSGKGIDKKVTTTVRQIG